MLSSLSRVRSTGEYVGWVLFAIAREDMACSIGAEDEAARGVRVDDDELGEEATVVGSTMLACVIVASWDACSSSSLEMDR